MVRVAGSVATPDKRGVPAVAWVIGVALGLGFWARFIAWDFSHSSSIGDRVGVGLLGLFLFAPGAFAIGMIGTVLVRLQIRQFRRCFAGRRRARVCAYLALVLFVALLVLSVIAAAAQQRHALSARTWVLVRLLVALLVGASAVFLLLWPRLSSGTMDRKTRRIGVAAFLWVGVAVYLVAGDHAGLGILLGAAFLALLSGSVPRGDLTFDDGSNFSGALVMSYVFVLGMGWLSLTQDIVSPSTLARCATGIVVAVVVGTPTTLMIWRRWHGARSFVRNVAAVAIVLLTAYLVFLALDDQVLGGALVAPVFPLAVWLGVRLWRRMASDARLGVTAGADIVFALVLGSVLVLFLMWLADVLALRPPEVQVLKNIAAAIGSAIDLSPWAWVGIYAVVAFAHLLTALGPRKYQAIGRTLASLHVVSSVKFVRATTTMTGIGLMVVALLGVVVPPSTGPILRRQIQVKYTIAVQQELKDQEEVAVYQAITAELTNSRPQLAMLTELVEDVHRTAAPDKRSGGASPAEQDLARRLGRLQGRVTARQQAPPERPSAPTPAALTGPLRDAEDLQHRLTMVQDQDTLRKTRDRQAEAAAELCASTVTSLMDVISLGHAEVLDIVREYVNGLAESPLGQIFLNWTRRGLGKVSPPRPPSAAEVVEPEPQKLAFAAQSDLAGAQTALPTLQPISQEGTDAIREAVTAEYQVATLEQRNARCLHCGAPGEPVREKPVPEEPAPKRPGRIP